MPAKKTGRRTLITGLGAAATAAALGGRSVQAQGGPAATPPRYPQDAWLTAITGVHRIILDVTTPAGIPDAVRFSGNLYTGHMTGYNVPESDVAVVVCLRHQATPYAYTDALWSKYRVMDPTQATPPSANANLTPLSGLAKRGVQFMVCGTASRALAGRIAGQGGDVDAAMKELQANLLPNGRIVPAGVVGVTHAQELGFSVLHVG